MPNLDATEKLFENALQYYVAGRFAFFARLHPTAGNQFHHAIEFILKWALIHLDESSDPHHNIETFWKRFKAAIKNADLDKFDPVIANLNKFESIRYPERILAQGMVSLMGFKRETAGLIVTHSNKPPQYDLFLDEIDEVFGIIFLATGLNPAFFSSMLSSEAKDYLARENAAAPFGICKKQPEAGANQN